MDLSLNTDGPVAHLRIIGSVGIGETGSVVEYLKVARENGSVRAIIDLTDCAQLPTTIIPILMRETRQFELLGGSLTLTGLRSQNPFLNTLVSESRFVHYRNFEEASASERLKAKVQAVMPPEPKTIPLADRELRKSG